MTPFERFHASVEKALERHVTDLFDQDFAHESYCLCPECVCVELFAIRLKLWRGEQLTPHELCLALEAINTVAADKWRFGE